jgi:protocatechuate 4,5-dioxygenase alpha chain
LKELLHFLGTSRAGAVLEVTMLQVHHDYDDIPGTFVFDGRMAERGYALNKMCFSFNDAENRAAYVRDENAYCERFLLNAEQRQALKSRNVLQLLRAGANIYYLAKWAGIFGLNVQQIGAQQRGVSEEAFKRMLVEAGAH